MLLVPDPSRCWVDPFAEETTICLIANVVDPMTKEGYGLDPRSVAVRAESYLKFTGIADTVFVGPEAEFFVFDEVQLSQQPKFRRLFDRIPKKRIGTRAQRQRMSPNMGYHIRPKEGYVPVAPLDTLIDLRNAISLILGEVGITSNVITTKSPPPDNAKLIFVFPICCTRLTI
jgi:glutamine synthetase